MNRAPKEVASADIVPKSKPRDYSYLRKVGLGVAIAVGAGLSAGGHPASAEGKHGKQDTPPPGTWYAPPMSVGINESSGFETSSALVRQRLLDALASSQQGIEDLGVYVPVDDSGSNGMDAETDNLMAHACAIDQAAIQHNMHMYMDLRSQVMNTKWTVDGVPDQDYLINRFETIAERYLQTFANCAPGQPLTLGLLNEVSDVNADVMALTAQHYEHFLALVIPILRQKAIDYGIPSTKFVIFNLSATQNPGVFIDDYQQAAINDPAHVTNDNGDLEFGVHRYFGGQFNYKNYQKNFVVKVDNAFNNIPIIDDEFSTGLVSNTLRVAAFKKAAEIAACNQAGGPNPEPGQAPGEFYFFQAVNAAGWLAARYTYQDPVTGALTPNQQVLDGQIAITQELEQGQVLCTYLPDSDPQQAVPVDLLNK